MLLGYICLILMMLQVRAFLKQGLLASDKFSSRFLSSAEGDTVVSRCTSKINALLKPTKLAVTSSNDDPNGSHIQIVCVSSEFEGKSTVQRQKLVYKAIWDELEGPVHAVDAIVAITPSEVPP